MKKVGIKLVIIWLVLGCNSKPKGLISENNMSEIIADLKVLDAKMDNLYLRNIDSSRVVYKHLQQRVFEKYETDSVTYGLSYDYYLKKKSTLLKIYENAEKILRDSIENITKPQNLDLDEKKPGNHTDVQ